MSNDSRAVIDEVDGGGTQETLGGGRFRRRPLAEIAGSASQRGHADGSERASAGSIDDDMVEYRKFLSRSPEQMAADERRAREWIEDFRAKATPELLDWIATIGVFPTGDLYPWRTWADFKASGDPQSRELLERASGETPVTAGPGM